MASKAAEFRDVAPADGGGDEVAEGVGSIIAAEALFVDVGFEDVGGLVGVVLEKRETFQEALAALMDEERGWDAGVGIAEALLDFDPALDAVCVGGVDGDAEVGELSREEGMLEIV